MTALNSSSLKWWHAQFNLAWRSVCHYIKKLSPWHKRHGLAQFQENYVSEGLFAYTPQLRAIAYKASHCTTCGACDAVCPLIKTNFIGPMRLVVSGMRGGSSMAALKNDFAMMAGTDCVSCQACEKACPEEIPIFALAIGFSGQ